MKKKVLLGTFFLNFVNNPAYAAGSISIEHNQGMNEVRQSKNYADTYLDLTISDKEEILRWDGVVDASARLYPDKDQGAIFSLGEAYLSKTHGRTKYSVGRKILKWNPNEKSWGLSDLNAQKGFNLTETDQEGINAFHFERQNSYSRLHVFASFLHIPQVNPTFTTKKGKIIGKNEWANLPPQRVKFQDSDVPIYYKVIYPKISEIVLKPSVGLFNSWEVSDNDEVYGYATYKPENSIRINATGYYEQFQEERAIVTAKPFINMHLVTGGGWKRETANGMSYAFNIERITPNRGSDSSFVFESLKIEPVYRDETYVTSSVGWSGDRLSLTASHIWLAQGNEEITTTFAKKPKWRNAVGFFGEYHFTDSLGLGVDVKRDLELADVVIKSSARWRMSKKTMLSAGIQLIDSPDDSSFWAPYRVNDSIFSRVTFVY